MAEKLHMVSCPECRKVLAIEEGLMLGAGHCKTCGCRFTPWEVVRKRRVKLAISLVIGITAAISAIWMLSSRLSPPGSEASGVFVAFTEGYRGATWAMNPLELLQVCSSCREQGWGGDFYVEEQPVMVLGFDGAVMYHFEEGLLDGAGWVNFPVDSVIGRETYMELLAALKTKYGTTLTESHQWQKTSVGIDELRSTWETKESRISLTLEKPGTGNILTIYYAPLEDLFQKMLDEKRFQEL